MDIPIKNKKYRANVISEKTNLVLVLFFLVYIILCLLPMLVVISASLTDEKSIMTQGYFIIPRVFSIHAYTYLFTDSGQIFQAYGVSMFVTVVGTIMSLILTVLYAYPLSRRDFSYRKFFSIFLFVTMIFNGGLVPSYIVNTRILGLKDSLLALIFPLLVSPFFVIIVRTFFTTSIPSSIIESAIIDGAGEFRILIRIIVPLSLPVIATIGLFNTLMYWNDWFTSLVYITSSDKVSLQYLMYKVMLNIEYLSMFTSSIAGKIGNQDIPNESLRMAMAVVGIGPIIFAYPFFQRYFIKGLTIGAIKG